MPANPILTDGTVPFNADYVPQGPDYPADRKYVDNSIAALNIVPGPFNLQDPPTIVGTTVTFNWSDPQYAKHCQLYKDDVAIGSVLGDGVVTTSFGPITAGTFQFKVRAWVNDANIYVDSNIVTVTYQSAGVVTMSHDYSACNLTPIAGPTLSFSRSGVKTFFNGVGDRDYAESGEAVFGDSIRVKNLFVNPAAPATQNITLRSGRHCVSITGGGTATVVVSGSNVSGTLTASPGSPAIFDLEKNNSTQDDTGVVTFTCNNSPTTVIVHRGYTPAAYQTGLSYSPYGGKKAYLTCDRAETPIAMFTAGPKMGTGWTKISAQTRTGVTDRAPDDSLYFKLVEDNTAGQHYTAGYVDPHGAGTYNVEFGIANDATRGAWFEVQNAAGSNVAMINPLTGAITTFNTGSPVTTGFSCVLLATTTGGDRTFRVTFTLGSTQTIQLRNGLSLNVTSTVDADRSYTGNNAGYAKFWGGETRAGAEWVRPQATNDGPRGQDIITFTPGAAYHVGDGTFRWRGYVGDVPAGDRYIVALSGSAFSIRVNAANKVVLNVGGVDVITSSNSVVTGTSAVQAIAAGMKGGDHALCVNGTITTSANAATCGATTTGYLMQDASSANPLNGGTIDWSYLDARQLNTELQAYTGSGPPPPPVTQNRFFSGHMVELQAWPERNQIASTNLTRLLSRDLSNFVGFAVWMPWVRIETEYNVYDWTLLDYCVSTIKAAGKKLILHFSDRSFWGLNASQIVPSYVPTYTAVAPNAGFTTARFWEQATMDNMIRVLQAIGGRYRSEPAFLGFQYGETAIADQDSGRTNSCDSLQHYAQIKRRAVAIAAAIPEFLQLQEINWPKNLNMAYLTDIANTYDNLPNGGGIGWPDTIPSKDGILNSYGGWYDIAKNKYTTMMVTPGAESTFISETRAAADAVRDYCKNTLHAHGVIWGEWHPNVTPDGNTWFRDSVIPSVNASPVLNTTVPW